MTLHSDNSIAERGLLTAPGAAVELAPDFFGPEQFVHPLRHNGWPEPLELQPVTDQWRHHRVSVIVPTKDEAASIEPLVDRLAVALDGWSAEVIFADDSADDTPDVIMKVAETAAIRVVCVHRPPANRHGGLGGAVLEGLRAATGDIAVVMDGDLQHPPECVPDLIKAFEQDGADVVLASRYSNGGEAAGLSNQSRRSISRLATDVAKVLFPRRLARVSDPMSGFFAVRLDAVEVERLRPMGFKIFLEILLRAKGLRVAEVGFVFAPRFEGESKASIRQGLVFFAHILRLRMATLVPGRRGRLPVCPEPVEEPGADIATFDVAV